MNSKNQLRREEGNYFEYIINYMIKAENVVDFYKNKNQKHLFY